MGILYVLISIIYCATFVAFMKTKQPTEERNYSNEYWDKYDGWEFQYIMLCIVGTLLWPLIIPFMIIYKIAFKILNKTNKQK